MDQKIRKLLAGECGNYIFPFFWQHGETEEVLREYMKVIAESSIGAVCVESRPHPDFVGEKWWQDMDVILDEARKRNMKVWILDDSHFPTGYANGALKNADGKLRRQSSDRPESGLSEKRYRNGIFSGKLSESRSLGAESDGTAHASGAGMEAF